MPKPEALVDRMKLLLSTGEDADVHFLVGDEKDKKLLKAHKIVLKSASDVFEAMFRFDSQNAKNAAGEAPSSSTELFSAVEIPDVDAGAFEAMLRFIYEGNLSQLNGENAMALLYAAKKYDIGGLVRACVNIHIPNLSNVFLAFAQARFLQENDFSQQCLNYIDSNADSLIRSDAFLQIDQNLLTEILERDQLKIEHEISIWNAALRWADAQCQNSGEESTAENRRAMLGPALFCIRFPLIPQWEFSKYIVPSRVLTSDELVGIFLFHCHPNRRAESPDVYPLKFPAKFRFRRFLSNSFPAPTFPFDLSFANAKSHCK